MAEFLTNLNVNNINDDEWLLISDLVYRSDVLGYDLIVPLGFTTDFASVPRLPGAYWLAGGKATKAAVVHDYLYRNKLCPRSTADKVFYEAMQATGQARWRRSLMWAGVRLFGWTAYPNSPVQG